VKNNNDFSISICFEIKTDELWFPEWEFGDPRRDATLYKRLSPSTLVSRWQTPILLLHGKLDFRCPLSQSLMAHAAARRTGVRAQLAVSETSSHWVLRPQPSLEWHRIIFDFLDEHY